MGSCLSLDHQLQVKQNLEQDLNFTRSVHFFTTITITSCTRVCVFEYVFARVYMFVCVFLCVRV